MKNLLSSLVCTAALLAGSHLVAEPDFGDSSSQTLTTKAWQAYDAKDYAQAMVFADKCIELYGAQAQEMQKALTAPLTEKEQIFAQWALNDVGTCYLIKGQSLEALGRKPEAITAYKSVAEQLPFAQCWDPQGWFWKPADAAREKLKKLEFDALS